ncbi:hypothetical protein K505DRAFT_323722 [Melanomma pulvis-pyrius CBS 109.77]|uniref:ATP-dependent RNA helicase DHX8 n=1 Tax=Melanomma pulvis-pyrius CBS 109.77 TaxID=1314802 RepID=A0A6A6XHQ7_9PLEO|nr:hypothetical protein K505DRAFT_323722 [Melanomma pulvis-pyrius CBS 109.77]
MPSSTISKPTTPFRQIRAHYDTQTITVYQAYSSEIASAAVEHQKLNASPAFSMGRMTWVKPSWAWMLYRAGYSYKDPRQTRILALTMTYEAFIGLLRRAVLSHGHGAEKSGAEKQNTQNDSGRKAKSEGRAKPVDVRVQWDPERTIRLEKLEYRSIQIGVPGALVPGWVEGIVGIEDVTDRARGLKRVIDEEGEEKVRMEELVGRGLVPVERVYEVDEDLRRVLAMVSDAHEDV